MWPGDWWCKDLKLYDCVTPALEESRQSIGQQWPAYRSLHMYVHTFSMRKPPGNSVLFLSRSPSGDRLWQPADWPRRAEEADEWEQNHRGAHDGVPSCLLQLLVWNDVPGKAAFWLAGADWLTGVIRDENILLLFSCSPVSSSWSHLVATD